ncbi:DUF5908 family protein [Desulfovibrio cuneatus]|uniref:DUF5908 family protein n=1 Tax=Desulfovibrio cuneatus TaxID=159728 RepID=UPI00040FAC03|nr:DUF5908 family protein [Desulfovibrio cuneatus]
MPVEIREINISMTLMDDQNTGTHSAAAPKDGAADGQGTYPGTQVVVDRCVDAVLQILKDRNEA